MGASRWLDANKPVGTSMSSAMATIAFSRFIKFFLLGIGTVDVVHRGRAVVRGATLQSVTTGSVYNLKYEHERRLDFCRRMSLVCPGKYCFRVWCGTSGPHLRSRVYYCYVFRGRSSVSLIRH